MNITKRGAVLLSVIITFATGATSTASAEEVVLATWGGSWGKGIKEQVIDPFMEETGIEVNMISGVSLANMKMIASQRNNPQVDVITMVSSDAVRAYDDGLLAPISPEQVPNIEALGEVGVVHDADGQAMFGGIWMYPYGIVYRTDKLDWDIDEWADLWDPRLKNKVAVSSPKYMSSYFLLMTNRIAGGDEQNLDPGFEKVTELGENLVAVADDSATQQRLLAQGEVWAAPMISGAAYKVIEQGVPAEFVIPAEGAPTGVDAVALVKNGPNAEAAQKFVNFWLRADRSAAAAEAVGVIPVPRTDGSGAEGASSKYALSQDEIERLVTFDARALNSSKADWIERWDREIAPMVAQ